MAKTISGLPVMVQDASTHTSVVVYWLGLARLISGSVIVLGSSLAILGTSWDIQWHTFVGRDRTLIPPHIMSLIGITLCGLAALLLVGLENLWARRYPSLTRYMVPLVDFFQAPLGTYVTGFFALNAGIAFPLDSYWHALYGIDVSIWAPFHVMILVAAACMPLGAAYTLMAAHRLLRTANHHLLARYASAGVALALCSTLCLLTYLIPNAISPGKQLDLGYLTISFFPVLSGILVGWTLISVQYALPGRWRASSLIAIYALWGLLFQLVVPPLTNSLVVAEHLTYRPEVVKFTSLSLTALHEWPLLLILAAPLVDLVCMKIRRHPQSEQATRLWLTLALLPACIPVVLSFYPWPSLTAWFSRLGAAGLLLSLLLGAASTWSGVWFGQQTGRTLYDIDQIETKTAQQNKH